MYLAESLFGFRVCVITTLPFRTYRFRFYIHQCVLEACSIYKFIAQICCRLRRFLDRARSMTTVDFCEHPSIDRRPGTLRAIADPAISVSQLEVAVDHALAPET